MGRSALKKKGNNLNDPLSTKLYKKQSNYADNLSQKVKKDFRNICHMDHAPKRLFSEIYATWTILQKDYFQKYMPHGPSSKKTIFRNICHMDHSPKTFGNFADLSLLIKSQILTTKLCWWRKKRQFLKMRRSFQHIPQ